MVYDKYNEKSVPKEVLKEFIDDFNYSCTVQPNEGFTQSDLQASSAKTADRDMESNLKKVVIDLDA